MGTASRRTPDGSVTSLRREFFRDRALGKESFENLVEKPVRTQAAFIRRLAYASVPLVGAPTRRRWDAMRQPSANRYLAEPAKATCWAVAKLVAFSEELRAAIVSRASVEAMMLSGAISEAEAELDACS